MIDRTGLTPEQNEMIDMILELPANRVEEAADAGLVDRTMLLTVFELLKLETIDENVTTPDDCVVGSTVLQMIQTRSKRQSRRSGNWRCR